MLTPENKKTLVKKGISGSRLQNNWLCFEKVPILKLDAAASVEKGIMAPAEEAKMKNYLEAWDTYKEGEKTIVKFVPASGAASRMFKNLFNSQG